MYPFFWTSRERGIFMRYNYEFKRKAVELYRQGKWIEAPADINNLKNFHDMIVRWYHLEENNSPDCLKHGQHKKWSPEKKYELVSQVIAGSTITSVAYAAGIHTGLLSHWIRKYKIWGYNGLINQKKGCKPEEESAMKKHNNNEPRKLNESEYEELIRLRAENAYIKAENEVIKKEIALREERQAALLKAKKQQSSKNSVRKDIN